MKNLLFAIFLSVLFCDQVLAAKPVVRRGANPTEVAAQVEDKVWLSPSSIPYIMAAPGTIGELKLDHTTEVLNANRTILITDKPILWFDCNGTDRNVIMPPEATNSTDLVFTIMNDSDGVGENIILGDDTPATLITIHEGYGAEVSCDGTSWEVHAKIERSTDAETITGTNNYKYTTPANLVARETGTDIDRGGYYDTNLQNIPDLASKGAGYWFDGASKIELGDIADLEFDTQLSVIIQAKSSTEDSSGFPTLISKYDSTGNEREWHFYIKDNKTLTFYFGDPLDGTLGGDYTTDVGLTNLTSQAIYGATYNAGTVALYRNGKVLAGTATTVPTSLYNGTASALIGARAVNSLLWEGSISKALVFNLALSSTEVKAFSSGAPVPYKYIGASQTELMPNQVDRDFSGASAWANVDINAYDETGDLTITANAADQYCTCPVASAPTTIGKRYRMTFDVANLVSTWTIKSFSGTQTLGTVSADGTGTSVEWTAETTGGYRVVADSNTSSADFDNFALLHIGCVLQMEQDGISHGQWQDSSGNELHGTVSGAPPTNLPANHQEKYIDLTVTGNGSFTLPMGYKIKSIIAKETAGNALTGGLDVGLSANGVEVVSGMAVAGSATVLCTLVEAGTIGGTFTTADDTIYYSDGDDDANWNSAELELRVQMQRLTLN